jgi:hypothetical protein
VRGGSEIDALTCETILSEEGLGLLHLVTFMGSRCWAR